MRIRRGRDVVGLCVLVACSHAVAQNPRLLPIRGVSEANQALYPPEGGEMPACPGGSPNGPISFSAINDGFCACEDGSDEPGTGACDAGELSKFHCENEGFRPSNIFPSRVNDGICDCCDGSDEWASGGCGDACPAQALAWNTRADAQVAVVKAGLAAKETYIELASKSMESLKVEMQRVNAKLKTALACQESKGMTEGCAGPEAVPVSHAQEQQNQLRMHVKNFGKSFEWYVLSKRCVEYNQTRDGKYLYAVCPFDKVVQAPADKSSFTILGHFMRWEKAEHKGLNPRTAQLFANGERCFNGPARSARVSISCGAADEVTFVAERGMCEYAIAFKTPAACLEADLSTVRYGNYTPPAEEPPQPTDFWGGVDPASHTLQ